MDSNGSRPLIPRIPSGMTPQDYAASPPRPRRHLRSREGCLTCKRRKVKCDEQRPRCSHCERLNFECKWRPQQRSTAQRRQANNDVGSQQPEQNLSPATDASPGASLHVGLGRLLAASAAHSQITFPDRTAFGNPFPGSSVTQSNDSPEKAPLPQGTGSDKLMDFFASSVNPPIIAEVETQKKWVSMRQAVVEMAKVSPMVRHAILAFSNLLLSRKDGTWNTNDQSHYEHAVAEVASRDGTLMTEHSAAREYLLAALFFLGYIDILESRLDAAHSNLKRAYILFQGSNKSTLTSNEKQLLLWIRLLDGRAVSAGGDGLFLTKDDEILLVEASPASLDGDPDDVSRPDGADDIEDVLFQVLYQPGVVFYQKVQSFMGRISKIDPWHRSRGTVEDEIEVMNIGAVIAADLRTLYEQRPPLMDYAVAGKLTEPHVSKHLAFVITRAFRTYLANFHASKVHLHRVAYKTLPLTKEASEALDQIRKLARQIVEDLEPEDILPVNMLWPLLMLGVEEQDPNEKVWIKTQILKMEKVATNARITAQVLEEVQARQEAGKVRMDIRAVMHAVFNSCFAIV
ncbi:hypothetical protein LRP88_12235 [Fusarium phalaenopsidis]